MSFFSRQDRFHEVLFAETCVIKQAADAILDFGECGIISATTKFRSPILSLNGEMTGEIYADGQLVRSEKSDCRFSQPNDKVSGETTGPDEAQKFKSETAIDHTGSDQGFDTKITDENGNLVRSIRVDFDRKFFGPDKGRMKITDANGQPIASATLIRRDPIFGPDRIEMLFEDSAGKELGKADCRIRELGWPSSKSNIEIFG